MKKVNKKKMKATRISIEIMLNPKKNAQLYEINKNFLDLCVNKLKWKLIISDL